MLDPYSCPNGGEIVFHFIRTDWLCLLNSCCKEEDEEVSCLVERETEQWSFLTEIGEKKGFIFIYGNLIKHLIFKEEKKIRNYTHVYWEN